MFLNPIFKSNEAAIFKLRKKRGFEICSNISFPLARYALNYYNESAPRIEPVGQSAQISYATDLILEHQYFFMRSITKNQQILEQIISVFPKVQPSNRIVFRANKSSFNAKSK